MSSSGSSEEELKTEISKLMKPKGDKIKKDIPSTKIHNDDTNPCVRESLMSFQCLEDNGYERDKCERYFTNYKNCRKFWSYIVRERKQAGITPHLPPFEEREELRRTRISNML